MPSTMSFLNQLTILCLVVLASFHTVGGSVTERRCNGTIAAPIPDASIGRTFSYWDDCYRPSATETVEVYRRMFVYTPLQPTLREAGCFEKYVMHYRTPGERPYIAHFEAFAPPFGLSSSEEIRAYCEAEEVNHRELLFAYGVKRDKYIDAVRLMIEKIPRIRDFGCFTDPGGFVTQVPGRAFDNVDVDPIISYLYNVAFSYGFCPA
ncbi:hypothetical protein FGB62_132g019 [Gracilaria domingensis]|nr:hypothetical protein FGB62_132g019 [Gracilaria domingensis]